MPGVTGLEVVMATSNDSRYPPKSIVDGKNDTFWATTGLYPQSFVLRLPEVTDIGSVGLHCYNVKELSIKKSHEEDPVNFEDMQEIGFDHAEGSLQKKKIALQTRAKYLQFVIKSGYDHFCSVHKLVVD